MMVSTLSVLELAWIVLCASGLIWVLGGLLHWLEENRARLREGLNDTLRVLLHGKIRLYSFGAAKLFLYLLLGIQSALLPGREAPIITEWQRTLAAWVNITAPLILIINVVLLILMLGLDDRDRVLLDRVRDREREVRLREIEAAQALSLAKAEIAEARADVAEKRADVAQETAESAATEAGNLKPRVGTAEEEITVHTGEITNHTDRLDAIEKRGKECHEGDCRK